MPPQSRVLWLCPPLSPPGSIPLPAKRIMLLGHCAVADGRSKVAAHVPDHTVRRVRHNGEIRWQGNTIYVSEALIGEPVGLLEDEDGGWRVYYGPIALGVITHGGDRLCQPKRAARGLVDNAKTRCPQGPQAQQQQQT